MRFGKVVFFIFFAKNVQFRPFIEGQPFLNLEPRKGSSKSEMKETSK